MFKFLIAVIVITLNSVSLFAADVPFPDDKLRALPVHVRYDAKRLYDETYHLFATGRDLDKENAYKLLFKGLLFGQTFGFTIDTDKLLNASLKKLVSKKEFQGSKLFFSKTIERTHIPALKKTASNRTLHRNNFKMAFDPALESLYKSGNIYALFIKGLLDYDEATDVQDGNTKESIANLELAAHHFCLPALKFCEWLNGTRGETNDNHQIKLNNITKNTPAYFDPFLYTIELIKNPFQEHIDFDPSSSCPSFLRNYKIHSSGLPVIDVLDKVKKSIMLTLDGEVKENYNRVAEKLTTSAGETRRAQPARKKYERMALTSIGVIGSVGGILSSRWSKPGAILTTTASGSLALCGAYKILSVSPVCRGDQHYIEDQLELISLYLTLKHPQNFLRDTEQALDVFKIGLGDDYNWFQKIYNYNLTLSQMILKKEGQL